MSRAVRGLAVIGAWGLVLFAAGDTAAETPRVYALTGGTVVTAPGEIVDGATVVLRDGLIEAVGAGIAAPSDAVVIDATGRRIYPGLIDAYSSLTLVASARPAETPAGGPPGRGAPSPTGAVHPVSGIRPETRARDGLRPFSDDRRREMERHRELGFTVVLAEPGGGILRGRSTAVLLADERPVAELIVRDDVAQHVALEAGRFGGGYPSSLMGVVAALRQTLLDTRRHGVWSARYATQPAGMRRPTFHAAFDALTPVIEGNQPLFVISASPDDTLLVDRLAREFDLDVVIRATGFEWEIAQQVAATGRVLVLSVGFPDKPEVKEDDEALEVSLRELRRYVDAAAAPGRLHEAGVRFALATHGLKNRADFYRNLEKMLDAGLDEEVALAALTTVPASLLGIDRTTGTLEPGKIANLVVTDGPLFSKETKVREVFVDGRRHEIEVKEKPRGDPDAIVDPRGEWSVAYDLGSRTIERTWEITGERDAYAGTAETREGTVSFDSVVLEGNAMTVVFPAQGGRGSVEMTVIIEGDSFEGVAEMGPRSVEVRATRTSGPEGGRS